MQTEVGWINTMNSDCLSKASRPRALNKPANCKISELIFDHIQDRVATMAAKSVSELVKPAIAPVQDLFEQEAGYSW